MEKKERRRCCAIVHSGVDREREIRKDYMTVRRQTNWREGGGGDGLKRMRGEEKVRKLISGRRFEEFGGNP